MESKYCEFLFIQTMKDIRLAREKLVEKSIQWREAYTDKTLFLKKQFEDVVGPGSYFRFEGKSLQDGSEYYCILGPAKVHDPIAKFFAGVRKLPATYSAGGQYFDSLDTASEYARVTWGIPRPRNLRPYNATHLVGISQRVEQWKQMNGGAGGDAESEGGGGADSADSDKVGKGHKGVKRVKKNNTFNRTVEAASGPLWQGRDNMEWWDLEDVTSASPPQRLVEIAQIDSNIEILLNDARLCRGRRVKQVAEKYKLSLEDSAKAQKTYIGYHPNYGGYICQVGPYVGNFERGNFKYGYFFLRKGAADEDAMRNAVAKNVEAWREKYGVEISPDDIVFNVKSQTKPFDYGRARQLSPETVTTINGLSENNPEYQQFVEQESLIGLGTTFDLNPRGLSRLIHTLGARDGWLKMFQDSAADIANKKQMNFEEMMGDTAFLRAAYNKMLKRFETIKDNPNELANQNITKPPPLKLKMSAKAGQQRETALRTNKLQQRELDLRQEVLSVLISGKENPEEILNILNNTSDRARTRRVFNDDTGKWEKREGAMQMNELMRILQLIDEIRYIKDDNGNVQSQKSYQEVYQDGQDILDNIIPDENGVPSFAGFDDLATAYEFLRQYITTTRIDPTTKAKVDFDPQMSSFNPPEHFINYTTEQLQAGTLENPDENFEVEEVPEEPIDEEVLEESIDEEVPEEIPEESIPPTSVPYQQPQPVAEEPSGTEENIKPYVNPLKLKKRQKDDLLANVLKSLIKIAESKDKEGKSKDAEEIHKLMRKYQKGS